MNEVDQQLHAGTKIGNFTIIDKLGEGGFGITYLAEDPILKRQLAIKEFFPSEMSVRVADGLTIRPRTNQQENYQYGLSQFIEEGRALAQFTHSNIVSVISFIEEHGTAYLAMTYEAGEDLSDYLKRINFKSAAAQGKGMPESEILSIIKPILNGLNAVHEKGLLHRDIKPGNIYLRRNQEGIAGEPMLIDFGAARYALGEHSKSMSAIISMGYAPPEQYTSRGKQGAYTDLYAIGATIYELITGKAPIESPDRREAVAEDEPDPLTSLSLSHHGKYSDSLLQVTDWCLMLSSKKRPQSANDVLTALETGVLPETTSEAVNGATSESSSQDESRSKDPKLTRKVEEGEHFGKKGKKNKKSKQPNNSNNVNKGQGLSQNQSQNQSKLIPLLIALIVITVGSYFGFT